MAAFCTARPQLGVASAVFTSSINPFSKRMSAARPVLAAQRRRAIIVAFKDERQQEGGTSQQPPSTQTPAKDHFGEIPMEQGELVQDVLASAGVKGGPGLGVGFETAPLVPAFTRRRERVVGRIAMLGFAAGLIGELLTGYGPVTQLSIETGITPTWVYTFITTIIAWTSFGASPGSPTWSRENQQDVAARRMPLLFAEPRKTLVKTELFLGRFAMTGFLGAVVLEKLWGGESPLAHVGLIQPGMSLLQGPGWVIATVGAFILGGTGIFSMFGDKEKDNDVW